MITPYFIKPTDAELVAHYTQIAQSVSIPVLAYNNPDRTGLPLSPAVAAQVAEAAPNFCGVKDSSGDLSNALAYMEQTPPDFRVFMGRDTLIYAALCCGCAGAVAATANVAPDLVLGIYNAVRPATMPPPATASAAWRRCAGRSPWGRSRWSSGRPELMGLPAGPARAP